MQNNLRESLSVGGLGSVSLKPGCERDLFLVLGLDLDRYNSTVFALIGFISNGSVEWNVRVIASRG